MNLTALRTFLAIVETGSLVHASRKLNVTQSTVTSRLKVLEEELGQVLVNRQKSGATLTAAGGRLKRYAATIDELWQQARQETALPNHVNTVCNIGCDLDLWPCLGKELFEKIRCTQRDVALSVWHGGSADLSGWLSSGLTDVSLTYQPNVRGNQTAYPIVRDRLILVSTDKTSPIKFDPGYVFVEAGEEFGRHHSAAYADADVARLSFGSASLGLAHILEHGGSAYLPERFVRQHLQNETLFHLDQGPEFFRRAYLLTNDSAVRDWDWFQPFVTALAREQASTG